MKRIGLLVTLCLLLIIGCETRVPLTSTISADKIVILHGVSSKASVITDEPSILEILKLYTKIQSNPISKNINPVDFYTVIYYQNN
ncbi:hypothetical protein [Alkaliphilus hydrothermalis]|uniref:Uncharacterized protein n=1 Tax=Alkaliphilus hydrothermalis TaxID=1482730 RepID=A0ABS2NN68_9FIRM|nr:hypothetical protein [Alkaliphilus hydrothermalis]MBM7614267.1 hypothetical protein [Alkaliphilus hydrothermalis]